MSFPSRGAFDLGEHVGRYVIVEEIGTGGMAAVYRARFEAIAGVERRVAIKAIHSHLAEDERFVEMFLDEARITSRIHHANVCAVLDFGVHRRTPSDRGVPYLVMEYLDGWALHRIAREPSTRIPTKIALRVVADAARGLHAAHELKSDDGKPLHVVHRDVSPQNIVVLFDGTTKILDFGVAAARNKIVKTETGEVRGKMAYMSPEQLRGATVDRRTDVWSLGVTLWEALLGKRLFGASSEGETVMKILEGTIPRPSQIDAGIPRAVDAVVARALDRDPSKRYASAGELSEALEDVLVEIRERASANDVARFLEECRARGSKPVEGTPVKVVRPGGDTAQSQSSVVIASERELAERTGPSELTSPSTQIDHTPSSLLGIPAGTVETPPAAPIGRGRVIATVGIVLGLATVVALAALVRATPEPAATIGAIPPPAPSAPPPAPHPTALPSVPPRSSVAPTPITSVTPPTTTSAAPPPSSAARDPHVRRPPASSAHASHATGTLTIFPNPAAAHVRVGGRDLGATPVQRQELAAGHYVLVIEPADGSPSYRVSATVQEGTDTLCNGSAPHLSCRTR